MFLRRIDSHHRAEEREDGETAGHEKTPKSARNIATHESVASPASTALNPAKPASILMA